MSDRQERSSRPKGIPAAVIAGVAMAVAVVLAPTGRQHRVLSQAEAFKASANAQLLKSAALTSRLASAQPGEVTSRPLSGHRLQLTVSKIEGGETTSASKTFKHANDQSNLVEVEYIRAETLPTDGEVDTHTVRLSYDGAGNISISDTNRDMINGHRNPGTSYELKASPYSAHLHTVAGRTALKPMIAAQQAIDHLHNIQSQVKFNLS